MNAMATPDFAGGAALEIALVNNMPDQALETTKAQFSQLLSFGAQGISFRLRCYTIASVPRSETARRALMQNHDDIEALYARGADALIVTDGTARRRFGEEPYWQDFARLVDWARTHTSRDFWSCLAAHAARATSRWNQTSSRQSKNQRRLFLRSDGEQLGDPGGG